jgi:hypothetical protein
MRKMKKKIKTLEEQMEEHTRKSNAGESLRSVNDNTYDEIYKAVELKSTWQGAVDILIGKLFTPDELRNQSISGVTQFIQLLFSFLKPFECFAFSLQYIFCWHNLEIY